MVASRAVDLKLEAVSSRLKGELIHPNKTGTISAIQFSPDGKRILAGDYPGGVIALWDIASGKQLTAIEAGYGYRSLPYYAVAPDWRTLFTAHEKSKAESVEQNGKRMIRWSYNGSVRAWSLETGKRLRTYRHQPPRNIIGMKLSPDGKTICTLDEVAGTFERNRERALSLWDVPSGKYVSLAKLDSPGVFSNDGKALITSIHDEDGFIQALRLMEPTSGREKWTVAIREKNTWASPRLFSHDDRLIFGIVRSFERPKKWDHWRCWMKWWDAASGRELASFECDRDDIFNDFTLAPNGQTLAVSNWRGAKRKLFLYSIAERRLLQTVMIGENAENTRFLTSESVFSPDGKWMAVVSRTIPKRVVGDDLDARDLPQPRIHLIETATGTIRETLIAPQAFSNSACFSPDGRTLATDGLGRVLLWDLTKPPGQK